MSSTRFNNNPNFATHNLCGLNLSTMKNKQNSSDDAKYLSLKSALKDMDFVCFSETKTPDTSFDYNYFFPLGKKFKQAAYSCNGQQDGLFILFNPNTFIHHSSVIHQRGRLIETKLKFITSGDQFIFFSLYRCLIILCSYLAPFWRATNLYSLCFSLAKSLNLKLLSLNVKITLGPIISIKLNK